MDNIFSLSRVALWRLLPQEYQVYISGSTGRESRQGAKEFWEAIWHYYTILIITNMKIRAVWDSFGAFWAAVSMQGSQPFRQE